MYIVAGKLKSRKLYSLKSLRIVEARIRKVLYNIFRRRIEGKTVLDLFGGSGSLGIEALSWGVEKAVFVDIKKSSLNLIKRNLASLGLLSFSETYLKDAFSACRNFYKQRRKFDFIFLDPPFNKGLLTKSLKTLEAYDIVSASGFIVSLGWHKEPLGNEGFSCIWERRYGDRIVKVFSLLKEQL